MLDACPQCGSKNTTLEPASNCNKGANVLNKFFLKLLREASQMGHKRRGRYVLSCKTCGKVEVIFID
jgi:rRNA maturation protein Nop10